MRTHWKNITLLIIFCSGILISRLSGQEQCCCGADEEVEVPGGDFEFSPYPSPGGWIDYTSGFGPWDVSFGSISHHDDGHNNLGAGNPNPSTAHLDLNGFSQGGVCQTISGFTVGSECTLTFFYAIHNGISSGEATVTIEGGSVLEETWEADNVGSDEWLEANYSFTATNISMELCFESHVTVNCCGMLLDDISFSCCPTDMEDPILDPLPQDLTVMCLDDVPEDPDIAAVDDCSQDLEVLYNEDIEEQGCNYIIYRDWSVEDDCGRTSEYTQLISVIDEEGPELIIPPQDLQIFCNDDILEVFNDWIDNYGFAEVDENCDEIILEVEHGDIPVNTCGEILVTFIFSDLCGYSVSEEAYFEVEDRNDPTFIQAPYDLIIPCDSLPQNMIDNWLSNNGGALATDDCSYTVINDFSGNYDSTELVSFTLMDFCGNENSATATIIHSQSVDTIRIDSTTCDPLLEGLTEIFIDSPTGCDSLIFLNIEFVPSDTVELISYSCDPKDVLMDTLRLSNLAGCDSVVYLQTLLLRSDTLIQTASSCDSSLVGIDSLILQNIFGCDSLIITQTTLIPADTVNINEQSCDPAMQGLQTFLYQNSEGCDSLVNLYTQYVPNDTVMEVALSCLLLNEVYDTSTVPGVLCDTILILHTVPAQNDTSYNIEYECELNETLFITDILPGDPCDSIVITEIIPLLNDTTFQNKLSCRIQDQGLDTSYYKNSLGCDSLVIVETKYESIDPIQVEQFSCLEENVGIDSQWVFSMDCDSLIITTTQLLESSETVLQEFSCETVPNDSFLLTNSVGCDSLLIIEYQYEDLVFDIDLEFDPCDPNSTADLFIYNIEGGVEPYHYILNNSIISDSPMISLEEGGSYEIGIQDAEGCYSEILIFDLEWPEEPYVDLPNEITILNGQQYQLNIDLPDNVDSFYWSHPELLSCSNCLDPYLSSDEDLVITLYIISDEACLSSRNISIKLKNTSYYIPNVFSPDGDKVNDEFGIFHTGTVSLIHRFQIYDRWGNLVFQKSDLKADEDHYWDGRFNDELLNPNVFVYFIELQLTTGERIIELGDILLLR